MRFLFLIVFLFGVGAIAETEGNPTEKAVVDPNKITVANESELSINISAGNSAAENYLLKQKTVANRKHDTLTAQGNLQLTQTKDATTGKYVESADNWKAGLRYDRALSKKFGLFVDHTISHDRFAGFTRRNVWDLGGTYKIIEGSTNWSVEAGYRNTFDENTDGTTLAYNSARVYTEVDRTFSKSLSGKFWIEYIPNLSNQASEPDYQGNTEISITSKMASIFSLKMAYLWKYDSVPNTAGNGSLDTLYTLSLLANW